MTSESETIRALLLMVLAYAAVAIYFPIVWRVVHDPCSMWLEYYKFCHEWDFLAGIKASIDLS